MNAINNFCIFSQMNQQAAIQVLKKIRGKWVSKQVLKYSMYGLALGLLTASLLQLFSIGSSAINLSIGLTTSILFTLYQLFVNKTFQTPLNKTIAHLDQEFPNLQSSTGLLLKETKDLNLLEQLQVNRLLNTFPNIVSDAVIPVSFRKALFLLLFCGVASLCLAQIQLGQPNTLEEPTFEVPKLTILDSTANTNKINKLKPLAITKAALHIQAPAYTQKPEQQQALANVKVIENSKLNWQIQFNQPIKKATLYLGEKEAIPLQKQASGVYSASTNISKPSYYHLKAVPFEQAAFTSNYFKIDVIPDQKPLVQITEPEGYVELDLMLNSKIDLQTNVSDDYGITDAYIMATVSAGEGESVKFREQKIPFDKRQSQGTLLQKLSKQIDLKALEVAPGNEVYFYVAALDNKTPQAQLAKSDILLVSIADTTQQAELESSGMAIKSMSSDIRSQRQIINDTEQLLKDKSKISRQEFMERANALGTDQKILRLRYGKFLGEEFESDAGGGHHGHDDHHGHDHSKYQEKTKPPKENKTKQALPTPSKKDSNKVACNHPDHNHDHAHKDEHDHKHHEHDHTAEHNHNHTAEHNHDHTAEHKHDHAAEHKHDHTAEHKHDHTAEHEHDHTAEHDHPHHILTTKQDTNKVACNHPDHDHDHDHAHEHPAEAEHDHDHATEHDHATDDHGHDHGGTPNPLAGEALKPGPSAMLQNYMHMHDIDEAATFFSEGIKAQLKAAMKEMWDAELHLRLGDLPKALPYEYKALKIIKEVQQKSRVYVHKVGFDPPPLNPEKKRYKGEEIDKVKDLQLVRSQNRVLPYKNCRTALALMEKIQQQNKPVLNNSDLQMLENAGQELSKATLEQQGNYLLALSKLRYFIKQYKEQNTLCYNCMPTIQKAFWKMIPQQELQQQQKQQLGKQKLTRVYYEYLYN